MTRRDSHAIRLTEFRSGPEGLAAFLAGQCDATKAKYAAELEHATGEWQKPLDLWYADSLEFFWMLERKVTQLFSGPHPCGSRIEYRRAS